MSKIPSDAICHKHKLMGCSVCVATPVTSDHKELDSTLAIDQVLVKAAAVLVELSYWDGDHLKITDPKRFDDAKEEILSVASHHQAAIQEILGKLKTLKEEMKQHTVPEGYDLITRDYLYRSIDFLIKDLEGML